MRRCRRSLQGAGLAAMVMLGMHGQALAATTLLDFGFNEQNTDAVTESIHGLVGTPSASAPTSVADSPSGYALDRAISFASGQNITVPDPDTVMQLDTTNPDFTLEAWVKFDGNPANRSVFFYNNGPGGAISFSINTDRSVFVTTLGVLDAGSAAIIPDDGNWHHIAVVHQNGVEIRYYVDGVLGDTRAYTGSVIFSRTQDYFVLGSEPGGGLPYVGALDRLKITSGALAPSEFDSQSMPPGSTAPSIVTQPQDTTVDEGAPASFSVVAEGDYLVTYQWYEDDVAIPGATKATYTLARAAYSQDGAKLKCVVTNPYGDETSQEATLTVIADSEAPTLVDAWGNVGFDQVMVKFSEPVDPATAETAGNYQLSGGVTVSSATLAVAPGTPGDNMVILTTSAQPEGTDLTLTVNNVQDVAGNAIAANSQATFGTFTYLPGAVSWERWSGGISMANLYALVMDPAHRTPDVTWLTSSFESGRGLADNYGARGYAWFKPATTGDYEFLLTCDDNGRALLSTDADPANVYGIAAETGYSGERTWTSTAALSEQYSYSYLTGFDDTAIGIQPYPGWGFVNLQAGQQYFLEVLWQEGGGGDGAELTIIKSGDLIPADGTPADAAGGELGTYYDPNTVLGFTTQPTDQVGVLASTGVEIYSQDFNSGNGGFTVVNTDPAPPGPFVYDSGMGAWTADGGESACTGPYNSQLSSPGIAMPQDGAVTMNFTHRYSFEGDLWDAGIIRVSVNGGEFTYVPAANFSVNGYAEGAIIGSGIANGLNGFNADSPGYGAGENITSTVLLGTFKQNDSIVVQFVGAWDDCTTGSVPGWVIDSLNLELLPMVIVDFADGDGGFTVENSGEPPANWGPWEYSTADGQWIALGADPNCGGPFNSKLTSPAYGVPVSDEVTLNFTHRYRLEGDLWDGGQVWVSVNGGAFTPVNPDKFTANGYAPGLIIGSGVLNGQRAFNGDSAGFDNGDLITSSVILGEFAAGDTVAVQFVGGWDDCWSPGQPGWIMQGMELVFGKAAQASTFDSEAEALLHGEAKPVSYQWQRDDGAGFVDITNANGASYTIYPVAADFEAMFRVVATTSADPNKSAISNEVKLVLGEVEAPTIGIGAAGGTVTVTFTGTLQSAETVEGPYTDVDGATSPYTVPGGSAAGFFRSVK
ncbi:MAG: Ig-like domain-containing protein [Verrucomicrobiales bacterium]|nr:Ig-like domain-containing protein [Verrucomicrobiales bacterium]